MRRSARYLVGIIAGTTVVLLAVAAGRHRGAARASPAQRPVLIARRRRVHPVPRLPHRDGATARRRAGHGAAAPSLAGGLLLGVANPKAWVAIGAVFVSVRLASAAPSHAGTKMAVLAVMIVVINTAWLARRRIARPDAARSGRSRRANLALAVALVVSTAAALVH